MKENSIYVEVYNGIEFNKIEEAINTSCPICGTPLDWTLYASYNNNVDRTCLSGEAESCGYIFILESELDVDNNDTFYYIYMNKKEI